MTAFECEADLGSGLADIRVCQGGHRATQFDMHMAVQRLRSEDSSGALRRARFERSGPGTFDSAE
jgi:hypothetical protein